MSAENSASELKLQYRGHTIEKMASGATTKRWKVTKKGMPDFLAITELAAKLEINQRLGIVTRPGATTGIASDTIHCYIKQVGEHWNVYGEFEFGPLIMRSGLDSEAAARRELDRYRKRKELGESTVGKTEKQTQAVKILVDGQPKHRGVAYRLLKDAGFGDEGGPFFNRIVKDYEAEVGRPLDDSWNKKRADAQARAVKAAHGMSSQEVVKHVASMDGKKDATFWACWALYRDGKWDGQLESDLFTQHFKPQKMEFDDLWLARCHDALHRAQGGAGPADYTAAYELIEDVDKAMPSATIKQFLSQWQRDEGTTLPLSPDSLARYEMRVHSHGMSADDVKKHIDELAKDDNKADPLFWQCWKLFEQGKWSGQLARMDFEPLFEKKKTLTESVNNWRHRSAADNNMGIAL